ncbi:hypothetical protein PCK2_000317 [Pneumocystis canis]|nr:hypothetical protein PCK2_000317 [Pneumocystis canis]
MVSSVKENTGRRVVLYNRKIPCISPQIAIQNPNDSFLNSKDLGRIASNYYISQESIEHFNLSLKPKMTETEVFYILSRSSEFSQMKYRG